MSTPLDPTGTDRYRREERLATGGMGEVWRARDAILGREVAVKVLKQEYADDPTFRTRFAAEARHAASLHHPSIASVFDYGELDEGHQPYLVMELVDGQPLSALLADGRPMDPDQVRNLLAQAADALAAAHAAGVVHRDVKPGNVMITPDGRVKLTDFGIARAADSAAITHTGQVLGTPHYLSPEQARGEQATSASDVYSLGVVLFECLAGHRPFTADNPVATALAHLRQEVPALPAGVPPDLVVVVHTALAKDPADRYPDGAALAAALRSGTTAPPAEPTATRVIELPPQEPPASSVHRDRWPLYAAGAMLLVLLVALLATRPWEQSATKAPTATTPKQSPGPTASASSSSTPSTVQVNAADYVGKPVRDAQKALEALGLRWRTTTRTNDGSQQEATVAQVGPTGPVPQGSQVQLTVWGPAAKPQKGHGPGGGHGKGNDQGNGD